jgi:hypothetical protein
VLGSVQPNLTGENMALRRVGDNASIVLIGSFNPAIFQPAWLERVGLVSPTEAAAASIEVITGEITVITLNWLRLEVTRDRLMAKTEDESQFSPLRDLILGAFRLLEHTPISVMGLNREITFDAITEDCWHAIGHALAPKNCWNKYVSKPGLKVLTIQAARDDSRPGYVSITVRPTQGRLNMVDVATNSHIEIGRDKVAVDAIAALAECWEPAMSSGLRIAEGIIQDCLEARP